MNGRTGIDYCAAYPLLDRMELSGRDWDDALDDLRVMEIAAIAEMNKDS